MPSSQSFLKLDTTPMVKKVRTKNMHPERIHLGGSCLGRLDDPRIGSGTASSIITEGEDIADDELGKPLPNLPGLNLVSRLALDDPRTR